MNWLINADKEAFLFLNSINSNVGDVIMSLFTRTEYWSLFFIAIIFFIFKQYKGKSYLVLLMIALIIVIADQGSGLVKNLVERLRPSHDETLKGLVHIVNKKGGLYGYFSAHASNTFGVATFLSLLFKNKRFSYIVFAWATIASYTRIYLGLHFPGDILTGIVFGLATGWAIYKLLFYIDKRFFITRLPRIKEKALSNSEVTYIFIVIGCQLITTILVAQRLVKIGLISL